MWGIVGVGILQKYMRKGGNSFKGRRENMDIKINKNKNVSFSERSLQVSDSQDSIEFWTCKIDGFPREKEKAHHQIPEGGKRRISSYKLDQDYSIKRVS